jgi:hypothetical protein
MGTAMPPIEDLVENASLLIEHFNGWPSFHDAEVIDIHCWRGTANVGEWTERSVFPVVTMKILIPRKQDHVVTLRFHNVGEITVDGFNHINQIFDFTVAIEERGFYTNGEKLPPFLVVTMTRATREVGMAALFRCFRIEVLDIAPWSGDG